MKREGYREREREGGGGGGERLHIVKKLTQRITCEAGQVFGKEGMLITTWSLNVHMHACYSIFARFNAVLRGAWWRFKGSVERSLLPWAIFLILTRHRPWKSEDHLCMLFFIEMSKERLKNSERTPPVSWCPWALAYSRDRPYNFSCLSALSKNGRFHSFFLGFGCHLARKSLSWPAMPVSNKKQEFEQRKRIKLFDDFWVCAYRFNFALRRRPRAQSM